MSAYADAKADKRQIAAQTWQHCGVGRRQRPSCRVGCAVVQNAIGQQRACNEAAARTVQAGGQSWLIVSHEFNAQFHFMSHNNGLSPHTHTLKHIGTHMAAELCSLRFLPFFFVDFRLVCCYHFPHCLRPTFPATTTAIIATATTAACASVQEMCSLPLCIWQPAMLSGRRCCSGQRAWRVAKIQLSVRPLRCLRV